jgi:hypothetical protein
MPTKADLELQVHELTAKLDEARDAQLDETETPVSALPDWAVDVMAPPSGSEMMRVQHMIAVMGAEDWNGAVNDLILGETFRGAAEAAVPLPDAPDETHTVLIPAFGGDNLATDAEIADAVVSYLYDVAAQVDGPRDDALKALVQERAAGGTTHGRIDDLPKVT